MEGEKVFGSKALDDADIAPTGSVGYNPPGTCFCIPLPPGRRKNNGVEAARQSGI